MIARELVFLELTLYLFHVYRSKGHSLRRCGENFRCRMFLVDISLLLHLRSHVHAWPFFIESASCCFPHSLAPTIASASLWY
jgi:hypothetical protein